MDFDKKTISDMKNFLEGRYGHYVHWNVRSLPFLPLSPSSSKTGIENERLRLIRKRIIRKKRLNVVSPLLGMSRR